MNASGASSSNSAVAPTLPKQGVPVLPHVEPQAGGALSALEHIGIPRSWLKRPKLPSRNWLIFLGTVGSIAGAYGYDRRECRLIKEQYVEKVKHLAEVPLESLDLPRKVTVYASKWPGDDEYDRSMKYFKKYVKPILVAAAVDFELKNGNQHGGIMRLIAERIKTRRRQELGLDAGPGTAFVLPHQKPERDRERELEGGIIIVGRQTFKEYMEGLKRGWTGSLEKVDEDDLLAQRLRDDGVFDELEGEDGTPAAPAPPPVQRPPIVFSPLQLHRPNMPPKPTQTPSSSPIPENLNVPPSALPPHPPLLFVPFVNILGFRNVPLMMVDFFNQRRKVQEGSEAAYKIIMNQTREFRGPNSSSPSSPSDLSFAEDTESYYRPSYADLPAEQTKSRKSYYESVPEKLKTARDLARRVREATKEEISNPPPTEVEIQAQRLKREKKWVEEEEAWNVLKRGVDVAWDERFEGVLKVYRTPSESEAGEFGQ